MDLSLGGGTIQPTSQVGSVRGGLGEVVSRTQGLTTILQLMPESLGSLKPLKSLSLVS